MRDTIAAIATATGAGGVGIVRLSGPEALAIAEAVVGRELPDRQVVHAIARDAAGGRLDDVLAFAMRAPRSFTGEDVAELHGHGGPQNLSRLLESVVERGARIAEPGEFTRRAVANGKLDLLRAEALLGVVAAAALGTGLLGAHALSGSGRPAGAPEGARSAGLHGRRFAAGDVTPPATAARRGAPSRSPPPAPAATLPP